MKSKNSSMVSTSVNETGSNKSITLANVIALIGLALLMVFTYLGQSYKGGGNMIVNILVALWVTAVAGFLLWFLIKAKGAVNSLEKWRIVEWVTLGVYVVFIICSVCGSWGAMNFFSINSQKGELQNLAHGDMEKITNAYTEYIEKFGNANTAAKEGLKNALASHSNFSERLNTFMSEHEITLSDSEHSLDAFIDNQIDVCLDPVKESQEDFLGRKSSISAIVGNWSVLKLTDAGEEIEKLAEEASEVLKKCSDEAKLPVVKSNYSYVSGDGYYDLDGYYEEFKDVADDFDGESDMEFFTRLKKGGDFDVTALILMLLIHGAILFNYLVAYRTRTLRPSKHTLDDGGITLKF